MDSIMQSTYDEKEKVWSGFKGLPMYHQDCSVGRVIHKALKSFPKNVCELNAVDGKATTNQDMLNWSVRIAQHLRKRFIGRDDVIGLISRTNTYQTAVACACFYNTTPFHAISSHFNTDTLQHILSITKPKVIFCEVGDYERIKDASSSWERELVTLDGKIQDVVYVEELLEPTKTEMFFQPQFLTLGESQTMAILCSSGTTGLPKAVCMANYLLLHLIEVPIYTSEMAIFSYSGLDWYSGLQQMLLGVGVGCTRIITNKERTTEDLLDIIEKYKVNMVGLGSSHVAELIASPLAKAERLTSLRVVFISGGWISDNALRKMEELAKLAFIFYGYGTTEIGAISASFSAAKFGNTVGKLIPGARGRIVSDEGMALGPKEIGEILIHNGHKEWHGYYGNQLETQKIFDSQSWFHTGDLGYFDEHHNLYIVDRKKDIYKCRGYHYWPNQIETVVASLPQVQEVCVVGIHDENLDDAPAALVVLHPGKRLTKDDIKAHVAKTLQTEYMELHGGVYFADALPKNKNGKILRRDVKEAIIEAKAN
ncbi:uncharacterized protein Dwil_GK15796 [Drosophila willistoni]|uniref:Uncharacterized protein n=1 Tax=Drosophila willistoni TaxID=7260 RepID=B4MRB0_DROWI|nr:4-coumarate--CoA ligase 3 [Drosophila willistoni]EDW74649.1 uncharacterized protein Dwil_GK15796 [Drosophila willistoni]